jgi:hypothetical protein
MQRTGLWCPFRKQVQIFFFSKEGPILEFGAGSRILPARSYYIIAGRKPISRKYGSTWSPNLPVPWWVLGVVYPRSWGTIEHAVNTSSFQAVNTKSFYDCSPSKLSRVSFSWSDCRTTTCMVLSHVTNYMVCVLNMYNLTRY